MPMMVLMRKIQVMLLAVVEQLCCYFLINTVAVAREIIYKPRRYLLLYISYLIMVNSLSAIMLHISVTFNSTYDLL